MFQLNQNVKLISQNGGRIMLTLKDGGIVTLDKLPTPLVLKTKEYLEKMKLGKQSEHMRASGSLLYCSDSVEDDMCMNTL